MIQLSFLDIFFIGTTIVSLVFNYIQWRKDKIIYKPIYNTLIGLFNDIGYKMQRGWEKRTRFTRTSGNEEAVEYCNEVVYNLRGFHEQVVAALKGMQPKEERWQAIQFGENVDSTTKEK